MARGGDSLSPQAPALLWCKEERGRAVPTPVRVFFRAIRAIRGLEASGHSFTIVLPLGSDEQLYGFGLSPELFDMRGRRVNLRPTDKPENDRGESHAPVPFYVSTHGYGVFVDTARYTQFFSGVPAPANADAALAEGEPAQVKSAPGKDEPVTVLVDKTKGADVYIFAGPSMVNVVQRYNLFAGGGAVPPLWGLGIWYRGKGDFSAAESEKLARVIRDQHMPCDVWGVEPGWQTKTYSSSFVWATNRFPDPSGFIRKMHAMGFHLNFWEHAFAHPTSPMYAALEPWSGDHPVWGGLVPDFAAPEGRRIFQAYHEGILFSIGADGLKLDECDNQPYDPKRWSFPDDAKFPSGLNGEQMHSLFGVLYQQTVLEPLTQHDRRTWGLVRNSQALAAPLPYGVYSDSYDHRGYVRGLVNEGFSGLLWVPELRDCASVQDLYRRVETLIFAPVAQIDCWYLKNPTWMQIDRRKNNTGQFMPDHRRVTDVIRGLFNLRMSLIPYLYSAFNEYHLTGVPPIRALVPDWPNDPQTYRLDDQFMFGPTLMVAPLFAGQTRRSVYLPAGDWYDFWTHEKFAGGRRLTISAASDQIPIFVKADSLVPLAKPIEYIG
ncbi:MAG: glycoside hydrolase, partial [Candidatus Omnitrophica bacterium]|nr:glycoside hydrolase [Candidatus Omnitrophota bacterium]